MIHLLKLDELQQDAELVKAPEAKKWLRNVVQRLEVENARWRSRFENRERELYSDYLHRPRKDIGAHLKELHDELFADSHWAKARADELEKEAALHAEHLPVSFEKILDDLRDTAALAADCKEKRDERARARGVGARNR